MGRLKEKDGGYNLFFRVRGERQESWLINDSHVDKLFFMVLSTLRRFQVNLAKSQGVEDHRDGTESHCRAGEHRAKQ